MYKDSFFKILCLLFFFSFSFYTGYGSEISSPPLAFQEIWAYLMKEEEGFIQDDFPISDLAYFSAELNSKGELVGIPPYSRLKNIKARKHLVIAEVGNYALTHFVLAPEYPLRDQLIADIVLHAKPFDGVQIDFEAVPKYDSDNYFQFLSLLKTRLEGKMLSVALPARTSTTEDAYNYNRIAMIADRIIVMAYDEHWSGSAAGSIASLDWSAKVSSYVFQTVGAGKTIMGLPFYGRAWGDKNPAKAYKYSSATRIMKEKSADLDRDMEGIPFFKFTETVNLILYFEDRDSLLKRAGLYQKNQITKIGFWRLGQEDPAIWKELLIKTRGLIP